MATALLAFATGGCVDPLDDSLKPQPEEPTLTFWIRVPGSMLTTKALPGDVASISPESMIYDVQVWVFDHNKTDGATKPLNYVYKDIAGGFQYSPGIESDDTQAEAADKVWNASYKIQMPLPKEFILGPDPESTTYKPLVDIYILANWKSIFNTKPDADLSLSQVRDMVFGSGTMTNAYFGTTAPTMAVPSIVIGEGENSETQVLGLPISAVYKGTNGDGVDLTFLKRAYNGEITLDNNVFKSQIGVIELERAVAKVRFVFAKTTNLEGVQITKIEIDGGIVPDKNYAFPRYSVPGNTDVFALPPDNPEAEEPTYSYGGITELSGLSSNDIVEVDDPILLRSDYTPAGAQSSPNPSNMSAQEYDTYLTNATSKIKPSTAKLVYFRESDKPVTGKIYYKKTVNGTEESKEFVMTPSGDNDTYTNLHRNHYWTVYAYFLGNGLYIKPVVLPWEDGSNYTYTQRGSAVVAISTKKETLFGYGWTTAQGNPWYQNTVVSISTQYNTSADNTMGEWTTTAPTDYSNNKYFWTRSAITLQSDPEDASTIHTIYSVPVAKSPKGDEGTAPFVSSISVQYALGESSATAPETGWSNTTPTWINDNTFIWSRTTTTYTDGTTQTNDVCLFRNTEWYFRRQDEAYTNNWDYDWLHSQMVSAPGLNAGGAPIYANRIELRTNSFNVPLRLKLSNPTDFYLVTYNAASANYVSWTEADGALIPLEITSSVLGGTTYFYVVPKDGADHEGKTTEAYLVTAPTDGTGGQKVPFNAGVFPGSNENTEINFYSVSVGKFKSYYDADARQNDNIKPYDKSGEVTI